MWKRFGAAWLAFWLGVVLAIIAWAVFSFQAGLVVFALGLLATIVLIVWALSIGGRKAIALGRELDERAQARKAAGSVTASGSTPTDDPSATETNTGTWPPDTDFGPGRRDNRW